MWDAENRLTEVRQGATTLASFSYDGLGRRAQKTAAGVTRGYVWDRLMLIEERIGASQLVRYVEGRGIDQHLARQDGVVASYYVADHLGSTVQETNSVGALSLERRYDPWGNLLSDASASGWAFTGREWDPETGLAYYRARYLDPTRGRFLSEDPSGPLGGPNRYAYVSGNPLIYRDPKGLWPIWGNWCGPDWTGGRTGQYDPALAYYYKEPIDPNDAACKRHDWCYYMCRTGFPCDRANRGRCMTRCDRVLAKETGAGTGIGGGAAAMAIWSWMSSNRFPQPGPDACGCREPEPPRSPTEVCSGGICIDDWSSGM